MVYLMIGEDLTVHKLPAEPSVEEVKDSMNLFLSVSPSNVGESRVCKAEVIEATSEDEEDEIDWEVVK